MTKSNRWGDAPQATINDGMSAVRDAQLQRATDKARATLEVLGIEPTEEQAALAGARLLKSEQADRARAAQLKAVQKTKDDFANWAVDQGLKYGDTLNAYEPAIPLNVSKRLCLMAVRDELDSPDGGTRPRLIKRLDAFVARAREAMQATSDRLDASLVEEPGWEDLPSSDDIAVESGEPVWGGISAEAMADGTHGDLHVRVTASNDGQPNCDGVLPIVLPPTNG